MFNKYSYYEFNEKHIEKYKKALLIGDYFQKYGGSTRTIADYFKENMFYITNSTVYDYLSIYKFMPDHYKEKIRICFANDPDKDNENDDVRSRVVMSLKLFNCGLTMEKISKSLRTDFWTTYNDLTGRLDLIENENNNYYNDGIDQARTRLKPYSRESARVYVKK